MYVTGGVCEGVWPSVGHLYENVWRVRAHNDHDQAAWGSAPNSGAVRRAHIDRCQTCRLGDTRAAGGDEYGARRQSSRLSLSVASRPLAALSLATQVHNRIGRAKRKLWKAEQSEHHGRGHFGDGRADGRGNAEMNLVL